MTSCILQILLCPRWSDWMKNVFIKYVFLHLKMHFLGNMLVANIHWKHRKSIGNKKSSYETLVCNKNSTLETVKCDWKQKSVASKYSFYIGSNMILLFQSQFIVSKIHFLFWIIWMFPLYLFFSNRQCFFPMDFFVSKVPVTAYFSYIFLVKINYF